MLISRKFFAIHLLLITILLNNFLLGQEVPTKGLNSITAEEMKNHVYYLASDEMRGRDTPSPELDSCAAYIAREFSKSGLKPIGDNGTYFQHYNVLKSKLSKPNSLKIITQSGEAEFKIKNDFVPVHLTANRKVTGHVVFAGFGITASEYNYDDYEGIDVKGKIVFILTHEPQEKDTASVFDGAKLTDHGKMVNKAINAREHGAIGMIVVTNPNNHRFRRPPNTWPSLMRTAPKNAIPLTLEEKMENKIVVMRIGKNLAEAIFAPSGKTISELQTIIDSDLTPQSFEIPNISVSMETNLDYGRTPTQNVVGLLEGIDPQLKKEVLVIGAHFDHLGARNDTTIFNGADDNASGTVGVMEVAEAFSQNEQKPKRSILFCTWSGEEKGLFGSRYYVESSPIFALEKTVANINLDMIGRNDSGFVNVSGFTACAELQSLVENENKKIGLSIKQRKSISGSDHVPFYRKGVPVLGFNTGTHADYHKITDTAEKCFFDGMSEICKLVYNVAWRLTNEKKRLAFSGKK